MGLGGLLGLLYFGGAVNAHKAIGSGCSYAWQGTKSLVADPFTTTPDELPVIVESSLQRYKKEIDSGNYAKEIAQLRGVIEQYTSAELKLEKLQQQFAGRSLETTLRRFAQDSGGDQRKIDYTIAELVDTLQADRSLEQRKKYVQQELANLAPTMTVEEQKGILQALKESSPDGQYKAALQVIEQVNKSYAAAQELAKLLTPQQRQSLALPAAVPTTSAAAPTVKPAVNTAKAAVPSARPALPAAKPTATVEGAYEKARQLGSPAYAGRVNYQGR